MKRILLLLFAGLYISNSVYSQITLDNANVPNFIQGVNGTNNNRTPFYFWVELSGLTPNTTYKYFSSMDTIGADPNTNGAGNALLINTVTGIFKKATGGSLTNIANHDTLTANASGLWKGWMGVEATGNIRFTTGKTVCPKIMINNGTASTTVSTRLFLTNYPVSIINYGTTPSAPLQGSFVYDSTIVSPKSFAFIYNNTAGNGRPISIAVVEKDGYTHTQTSVLQTYRTIVDTINNRWGTIVPNNLATGIQRIEYRNFTSGSIISSLTDGDGNWCWTNTVNPVNGTTPLFIRSIDSVAAPIITTQTGTYCSTDFITINATASSNINWFTTPSGGTSVASGTSVTLPALAAYYAETYNANGCASPRTPINFTVITAQAYYIDSDGDSFGTGAPTLSCTPIAGYVLNNFDCNDNNPNVFPSLYYTDNDNDSYGTGTGTFLCVPTPGYSLTSGDCNDNNAAVNPGAIEICDAIDNNCNNQINENIPFFTYFADLDNDNYVNANDSVVSCAAAPANYMLLINAAGLDCNDNNNMINPGMTEACNGIDDNCNNQIEEGVIFYTYFMDADSDNYVDVQDSVVTCGNAPANYILLSLASGTDCDDSDDLINPGVTELCNGYDDDCDNQIDEGCLAGPDFAFVYSTYTNPAGSSVIDVVNNTYTLPMFNCNVNDNVLFYIKNTGDDTLFINSVDIINQSATHIQFSLGSTPSMVMPGDSGSVQISFVYNGQSWGADSALISIDHSDADENPFSFSMFTEIYCGSVSENEINVGNIYPSPTSDNAYLSLMMNISSEVEMNILDLTGKKVFSQKQMLHSGQHTITIPSSNLSGGMYIVEIMSNQQKISTRLIKE